MSEKKEERNEELVPSLQGLPFNEIDVFGKEFQVVELIGRGAFGKVLSVQANDGEELAIKVVISQSFPDQELEIWPKLQHKNLLPLIQVTTKDMYFVFVMPVYQSTLRDMIQGSLFRSDPSSFEVVKEWLKQIASGLKYLHDRGLCHLDLKMNNVLISKRFRAVISDFGSMDTTEKPIKSVPNHIYKAPEVWLLANIPNVKLFGGPVDIWDFGILALSCFVSVPRCPKAELNLLNWITRKYPAVDRLLKLSAFKESLKEHLPNAVVSEKDCAKAQKFIRSLLRFNPKKRPKIDKILKHSFLLAKMDDAPLEEHPMTPLDEHPMTPLEVHSRQNNSYTETEVSSEEINSKENGSKKSPMKRLRGWFRKQAERIRKCFCCCCSQ